MPLNRIQPQDASTYCTVHVFSSKSNITSKSPLITKELLKKDDICLFLWLSSLDLNTIIKHLVLDYTPHSFSTMHLVEKF